MTNNENTLADNTAELVGILKKIPPADTVSLDDMQALGKISKCMEEASLLAADARSETAQFFESTRFLCDRLIMGEVDEAEKALDFIFNAVSTISNTPDDSDEIMELQKEAEKILDPATSQAKQPDPVQEQSSNHITIHSEEDFVIYTEFISESTEHLEEIEESVLRLESDYGNVEIINSMFRCFHSMKGAAGFLGLKTVNTLCHELETLLDRARKFMLVIDKSVIDVLLQGIDTSKQLLCELNKRLACQGEDLDDSDIEPVDIRPALAKVKAILERGPDKQLRNALLGEAPESGKLGNILLEEGKINREQLEAALEQQKKPVGQILVDMGAADSDSVNTALAKQTGSGKPRTAAIKVDTNKLDALMETVGELAIAETLVAQDEFLLNHSSQKLGRNIANLSKITRDMQELVMAIRMVPLRQTFQKMKRLIRDTSQKTGKKVRLEISGEDTEIDKTLIDAINDPLVHLLRNSVDHGIEKPHDRASTGKPEEGIVELSASHEGGNVNIRVTDDGGGLDRKRILDKAIERGLADADKSYSDSEIYDFIFLPGFSTNDKASEISGRGVGMDVVRQNVERLGGRSEVESVTGKGSCFTIRLPLTMAIVDGMIVRVGDTRYVLPTLVIEESIRPNRENISTVVGKGEMLMVRGDLIPLLRLHQLFDIENAEKCPWESLVIVVNSGERRFGIMADELLGQQQVVIKNLGTLLKGIRGVSGGCILGDGQVGLIIDTEGLMSFAGAV